MTETLNVTKTETTFKTRGLVFGNFWGGGAGSYEARRLTGTSMEDIREQATKGLDGTLDNGMGFESLKGALLDVEITTTITLADGTQYHREDYDRITVGELTDSEIEHMEQRMYF